MNRQGHGGSTNYQEQMGNIGVDCGGDVVVH